MIPVLLLIISGCKGDGYPGARRSDGAPKSGMDPPAKKVATFKNDVQPILSTGCALPSCHGAAKSADLQLSAGVAYGNIVNVKSSEDPHFARVKPGEPDSSYVVLKLEGRQPVGRRMPLIGGPLTKKEIQVIRSWIEAGAKNN
jgi:hypothetical protein